MGKADKRIKQQALFINGVFNGVFKEILSSQNLQPDSVFYLQPYSSQVIKDLKINTPDEKSPSTLYASITTSLNEVHYEASIVGWVDKRTLFNETNARRRELINEQILKHQPNEGGLYQKNRKNTDCANLILIKNVKKLKKPFPVSHLVKLSNGKCCKYRSRAGGWSYVLIKELTEDNEITLKSVFDEKLEKDVKRSLASNAQERRKRLLEAPEYPTKSAVLSHCFNRNSDVIAEVIIRASGICELCENPAPFKKASDGSPYLEVHHWLPLADGGKDTVSNAAALCPSCHKQAHFGIDKDYIRINRSLPKLD